MNPDKVDTMIPIIAVLLAAMLVGITFNVWQLAWFALPVLATVLVALGCLNREDEWGPTKPWIIGSGVVFLALFVWAGTAMTSQEPTFGGLSAAMGVALYVIWPVTLIAAFLYAHLYRKWLSADVREETSLGESTEVSRERDDARDGQS